MQNAYYLKKFTYFKRRPCSQTSKVPRGIFSRRKVEIWYRNFSGEGPSRTELVCLIEYDGEQHYTDKVLFGDSQLKERDKEKEDWCEKNDIPLIRIREKDYPSPESIYNFLDSKLIPALPLSSLLTPDRNFSEIQSEKIGQRVVELNSLNQENYSIKDIAQLLNYSTGYISDRIRNFSWFSNWSGKSNLEITPYSINREDLIKGLAQLQFLIDENGNRIPPLDDSHLSEIISGFNQTEIKKRKKCYWFVINIGTTKTIKLRIVWLKS